VSLFLPSFFLAEVGIVCKIDCMSDYEQFKKLFRQESNKNTDAIVLLAGDRFHRIAKVVELYTQGVASQIVITSGAHNYQYGSLPAHVLARKLIFEHHVPREAIIAVDEAMHSRAEADATLALAQMNQWNSLVLVTTEYHQYRALLTWLKAMKDKETHLSLQMRSVSEFPAFHTQTYEDALASEFEKIDLYGKKGDVATIKEGITYLQSLK